MAENKGFDLSALIQSVPDLGTDRQQIVYIPIDQIDPDPDNFYSLDGLDELAGSIEMLGLQQPPLVRPGEGGRYVVISGHRRLAAIKMIRDGGSQQFAEGVPCIIDAGTMTDALREFKLIMANMDTRKMTNADENKQAERVELLLVKLEDEGFQFSGRRRDWVAKITGMSRSKLNRLKVIRDKLAPEIKEKYYDTGKLNENTAYTLAQMEPELQLKLFKASQNATAAGYERIAAIVKAGNDYSCAELTGPGCKKCTHGMAFLRHDLEEPLDPCKGETCCLRCSQSSRDYWPCERMCSKAKDRRAKRNAEKKERENAAQDRRTKKVRLEVQASAVRLLKAIDAAGLGDDVKIPGRIFCRSKPAGWIRKAANGEDIGFVYENELAYAELDVAEAAKVLHCSADYICGLTEDLTPKNAEDGGPSRTPAPTEETDKPSIAFRWRTGDPGKKDAGWAVVKLKAFDMQPRRVMYWRAGAWRLTAKEDAPKIDDKWAVVGWFPLPPDEEVGL